MDIHNQQFVSNHQIIIKISSKIIGIYLRIGLHDNIYTFSYELQEIFIGMSTNMYGIKVCMTIVLFGGTINKRTQLH